MLTAALALMLIQTPPPQSAPEWVAAGDDETVAAVLAYDHGLSVIVLCRDERLETRIGGLPASTTDTRYLEINVPDSELRESTWIVGADQTTALSTAAGVYARRLRAVERLTVRVPAEGDSRALRYELPLPEAHLALDAVLTACGAPLERAEDADYKPESSVIVWARQPLSEYPGAPNVDRLNGGSGTVQLDCLAEVGGDVGDCQILAESPSRRGFGRAAVTAAERSKVARIDGREITEGVRITFTIRFQGPR